MDAAVVETPAGTFTRGVGEERLRAGERVWLGTMELQRPAGEDEQDSEEGRTKGDKEEGPRRCPDLYLVLLQMPPPPPPRLKEALLCGRPRSNRPSSRRRLRLDMVSVRSQAIRCSLSQSDTGDE